MLSKPKTANQEIIERTSLLNKFIVAPVRKAFSFVKDLVSNDREVVSRTYNTPDKFIISKRNTFSTQDNESFEKKRLQTLINLEDLNTIKKPQEEFLRPNQVKRAIPNQASNNVDPNSTCVTGLLPHSGLSDFEKNILKSKNVKISEDFSFGKNFNEPCDPRKKKIQEIVSSVKYTIVNLGKYTAQEITLAKRIVEDENAKKLQKYDMSKLPNPESILRTKFDPSEIIHQHGISRVKPNLIKQNNVSFGHFQDNISHASNSFSNANITYVKCDEVSDKFPEKKLFHPNPRQRTYDQHLSDLNIEKEENEMLSIIPKQRCRDCLKKDYELNQMKIKFKDKALEYRKNPKKNQTNNSQFIPSQEQTPSTINRNYTNVLNSGSFTMSQSRESSNSSFVSDKGNRRANQLEYENRNIYNYNLKSKPSAILEDNDEENYTASKNQTTPKFISIKGVNSLVFDPNRGNANRSLNEEIPEKIENPFVPKKDGIFQSQSNVVNFEINAPYDVKKNLYIAPLIKNVEVEDKTKKEGIFLNEIGDTNNNQTKPENEIVAHEENKLKSIRKDLSKNFDVVNKILVSSTESNVAIIKKIDEPKINIQLNTKTNKIKEISQIDHQENTIIQNQNLDQNIEIERNISENLINSISTQNENIPIKDNSISEKKFISSVIPGKEPHIIKEITDDKSLEICEELLIVPSDSMIANSNITNPKVEKQFIERPKGSVAKPEIPIRNDFYALGQPKTEILINNPQSKLIPQEEAINKNELIANDASAKQTNLLTDQKTNPFLRGNFQLNDNKGMNIKPNLIHIPSAFCNNIPLNNNFTSAINPINVFSGINTVQASSPSSSTFSDVTFAGKNAQDSSTNQYNANVVNHNAFFGAAFTSNPSNPFNPITNVNMNNYVKNDLATVCEEGKMSVEKVDAPIGMNSKMGMSHNVFNGNNAVVQTNNTKNNFNISNPQSNQGNFVPNTNNRFGFKPEPKVENNFAFKNNNQLNIPSNNQNWPLPNSNNLSNSQFGFGRNNCQPEVNNINKANPFMINNNNNNNTAGGLGLFDDHQPTQRKMGGYRR